MKPSPQSLLGYVKIVFLNLTFSILGSPSSWHEDEEMSHDEETPVPELKLPKSSEDLLLPHNLVLQALSVYEVSLTILF